MSLMQLLGLELKRLWRNRFTTVAVVVILMIPLLYGFLYLDAFWDPYGHLDRLQIAVVNQDVPISDSQNRVQAGQDLVAKLKGDHTVGWVFTNEPDALAGLNSGKYALAIVIPKNFSQTILATTKDPQAGQQGQQAKLLYYSNPGNNYLAEQIGNKVISSLTGDLNGQIAGNFLANVFGSLGDLQSQLQTAADGSNELADGISQARSGSSDLNQGLQQAVGGSGTLQQGMAALAHGSNQLVQGSAKLADGAQQLRGGSAVLQGGVGSALDGSTQLLDGSASLQGGLDSANNSLQNAAKGSSQLASGLASAYASSNDLNAGLSSALNGAGQLKDGAAQLADGLRLMRSQLNSTDQNQPGVPVLIQGAGQIATATAEPSYTQDNPQTVTNGVKVAGEGIGQVVSGLNAAVPQLSIANSALGDAKSQLEQALSLNPGLANDQHFMTAYNEVVQVQQGIQTQPSALNDAIYGLSQIQQNLSGHSSDLQHPTVLDGLRDLNSGAAQLQAGLQTLLSQSNGGLDQLQSGAEALSSGAGDLDSGLNAAYTGSAALSQGLSDLNAAGAKLASGLAGGAATFPQLLSGGQGLQTGLNQLQEGLNMLAPGFTTYASKLDDWVQGAVDLVSGAKSEDNGAVQAVSGAAALHNGLVSLQAGSSALTAGLDQAVTGSHDLTSGLKSGVDQLQTNLPHNPSVVAKTMGEPVAPAETQVHPVQNYGTGFAPYFIPLALWVGALMLFFVINLTENSLWAAGVPKVKILIGKYLILALLGTAQAVIISWVIITFLGLEPVSLAGFYGLNVLQSLSYVAIMFLLVERLDMAGRFVAIVLLMLQLTSGGGTFPVVLVPKFFQAIHPYLPMTYAVAVLRHVISGSSDIALSTSVLVLAVVGLGALLLTLLLSPKWLRIRDLHPAPQLGD